MKRILLLLLALILLFTACAEEDGEEEQVFTPGAAYLFAGTEIFSDANRSASVGTLEAKLVVYAASLIELEEGRQSLEVIYLCDGALCTGYVKPVNAFFLSESALESYIAETGETADGSYGSLLLMNASIKAAEEPEEPEEPENPEEPERPKRNRQGRITGNERGTPGIYTHVRGDWEMASYWGIDTETLETNEGALLVGGEEIGISGENLNAAIEGEMLILTGDTLTIGGEALMILRESGIAEVLVNDIRILTDGFLSGSVYGGLRAEGIGDRKIDYTVNGTEVTAEVLGEHYLVSHDEATDAWELERSSQ